MTEKEIKPNDVSGKKLEDLTEEELEAIQGQGDVSEELITITCNETANTTMFLSKLLKCKR